MNQSDMPKVIFSRGGDRVIVVFSATEADEIKNATFNIKQFVRFQMFLKKALEQTEGFVDTFNNTLVNIKQSFKISNHPDGLIVSINKVTADGKCAADFVLTKEQAQNITGFLV